MLEVVTTYLLTHLPADGVLVLLGVAGAIWLVREAWIRVATGLRGHRQETRIVEDRETALRAELAQLLDRYRVLHQECAAAEERARQAQYERIETLQGIRDLAWRLRDRCVCGAATCMLRDRLHTYLGEEMGEVTGRSE